ncbi:MULTISPECIES: phage tail protein [unclassified Pseudomonas]|uniref:phage tail protein n=1 Tax=unclassified Pseudomonas TaxID=196821 RepID=UPI000C881BB1|nr:MULTISPECIES: phage tail protein [unclassified Pseudomonas]PNA02879.1 host specificity protein [Pseudomonas sp. FW305-42]PNA27609.1 host specificity protein [Pseudomonas sp. MPR-R1B]PNB29673.1 host specificity protein [Pseudomonas sp. DP16D-E2]PNB45229.1 host specificity protein [Pseudomonas sp. FW305-17]PNB63598.1 host specificity protein [Pseudomonas sp. GW531-E2]
MGETNRPVITGRKGGQKKPKTPIEAPDSLRSVAVAKMLLAIGEGEFAGTPTPRDIYLDGTPLMDEQGNYNFPGVKWEWRTGSVEQPHIPGIPSVDNEISQGIELRSDKPWVHAISDTRLSAVRLRFAWPALQAMDSAGNINGHRIEYVIEVATDGGAYQEVLKDAVHGKTTSTYERTRRIDLPAAQTGWTLRVRRLTPNQNNNKVADTMQLAGLTEVIDAKLRYPNTALLYIEFSAEQFRNIPAVTVECRGRKWPVPSNYDPDTRAYIGVWDGTFKEAWTDNPAWVTYGICTNDRFGLGRRIKPWMVDKWELYRIAQYCDQLVPDGKGGQEPRFICNLNLQSKAEAWSLLRDIAGIYRGMTYWAQGQLYSLADMPRATDFDFAYTRANVIGGKFNYSSGSERSRYSRALISYDNPLNSYDTDVTVVTDEKLQRRYGDNPLEISAIGCTRESEAQRRGKWALATNARDRGISFRVGMDGRIPLPGFVIPVADELLAGRAIGGRIAAASGRQVTLDRDTQAKAGDRLILNLPDGTCEARTVEAVAGRRLTLTTAYSVAPEAELVWALDAPDLSVPLYRVTSVSRPEPGVYEISAVQYEPSKFAHIDSGARLEERPISVTPINLVPPPNSVSLSSNHAVSQGLAVSTLTIAWPAVPGAVAYEVEWRKDDGNWISLPRSGATSVDVTGIYAGDYLARVRSISVGEITSIWKLSELTPLKGKLGTPPAVAQLLATSKVFAIALDWRFPEGTGDTQRTEIWYGSSANRVDAKKLGDFAYPQAEHELQGLAAGAQLFFWARLVDRSGNVGKWYPEGIGVRGQSSAEQSDYDRYFSGKISESALGKHLFERIELIDGTGNGSVNQRLQNLNSDVQTRLDDVARAANALSYDSAKAYVTGDIVRQAQGLYQALKAVPIKTPPPSAGYWLDVGQVVKDSNGLAARMSKAESQITAAEGVNTVQNTQLTGLQSALSGKADAAALTTLSNKVSESQGKLDSQASAITGLKAALGQQPDNLVIKGDFEDGDAQPWTFDAKLYPAPAVVVPANLAGTRYGKAIAFYGNSFCGTTNNILCGSEEQFDLAAEVSSDEMAAGQTAQLQMQFYDKDNKNLGYLAAFSFPAASTKGFRKLSGRVKAPAGTVKGRILIRTEPANGTGRSLWCNIVARRVTQADNANAGAISELGATVSQQGQTLVAQGSSISDLTSRVGDVAGQAAGQAKAISTLQTQATQLDGKVTAQGTRLDGIYAQVNPPLAGSGSDLAGSTQTLVGVWSEQSARIEDGLAMARKLDTVQVQQGQTNASVQQLSQAQVGIDKKLSTMWSVKMEVTNDGQYVAAGVSLGIEDKQSRFLVRADNFSVVGTQAGGQLFTPFSVNNGQVFMNSALIQDGTISSAKIGNVIQSNNYVAGRTGWRLDKSGAFEINGSVDGQGRLVITNQLIQIFDANNTLRVRMGIWG